MPFPDNDGESGSESYDPFTEWPYLAAPCSASDLEWEARVERSKKEEQPEAEQEGGTAAAEQPEAEEGGSAAQEQPEAASAET